MPEPAVSVAICMHNGLPFIEETLDSVFAQSFQNFEIVIIDDGSTDGSPAVIERRYADPRLRIVGQRRQTLRGARPAVLELARGKYVAFLDHDDVWLPDKLTRQVDVAEASGAALVFSDCFIIDEAGAAIGRLSDQYDFGSIDLGPGLGLATATGARHPNPDEHPNQHTDKHFYCYGYSNANSNPNSNGHSECGKGRYPQ